MNGLIRALYPTGLANEVLWQLAVLYLQEPNSQVAMNLAMPVVSGWSLPFNWLVFEVSICQDVGFAVMLSLNNGIMH